ncbi:unnamed protein product [Amoebophrya sp. A25]|nr:unnamed protein product [Amoebophrya sp. A25]|eukprot:GSA25T00007939001.1
MMVLRRIVLAAATQQLLVFKTSLVDAKENEGFFLRGSKNFVNKKPAEEYSCSEEMSHPSVTDATKIKLCGSKSNINTCYVMQGDVALEYKKAVKKVRSKPPKTERAALLKEYCCGSVSSCGIGR